VDWLTEIRPSFSPPRRDVRPEGDAGAVEVFSQRLDNLNLMYESLVQLLSQRLRTSIEVNGAEGLVSIWMRLRRHSNNCANVKQNYAESLQRPLKTYRTEFKMGSLSTDETDNETFTSYSKAE